MGRPSTVGLVPREDAMVGCQNHPSGLRHSFAQRLGRGTEEAPKWLFPWNYPQPKIVTSSKITSSLLGSMHPMTGQCRVRARPLCLKAGLVRRAIPPSELLPMHSLTWTPSQPTPIAEPPVHFVSELSTRGQFTDKQIAFI